jgi:hypothetical protein
MVKDYRFVTDIRILMNENDLIYGDLTRKVIGAIFEVHNNLGSGLLEKHYQKALAEEFKQRGEAAAEFPEKLIFKDRVVLLSTALWIAYMGFLIYTHTL